MFAIAFNVVALLGIMEKYANGEICTMTFRNSFNVGDRVEKYRGGYKAKGTVIATGKTRSGAIRYMVEYDVPLGLIHIHSDNDLRAVVPVELSIYENMFALRSLEAMSVKTPLGTVNYKLSDDGTMATVESYTIANKDAAPVTNDDMAIVESYESIKPFHVGAPLTEEEIRRLKFLGD
jgi:hypothetical protein